MGLLDQLQCVAMIQMAQVTLQAAQPGQISRPGDWCVKEMRGLSHKGRFGHTGKSLKATHQL